MIILKGTMKFNKFNLFIYNRNFNFMLCCAHFSSISALSGLLQGDNERLFAMELRFA